ncbi:hypothetical protein [Parerythrobacter lacustris]|uniref:Uncharacterized protein n=1 Tax=Parerythrobacter lacustris TaxID=2969984 RepID=A0ABT1XSE8_9SPHN|nr:hypothetical protein [Parerythrobacter lacustris]MCR2833595.1 hypothetical protein [Parerythrobacter lacustris]
MVVEVTLFVVFALVGLLAVLVVGLLFSHLRQGPSVISDLIAKGFGIRAWLTGNMPDQYQATSIDVIEGVEFEFDGRKVSKSRQTRTTSAEV